MKKAVKVLIRFFNSAEGIIVSPITRMEFHSAIERRLFENSITIDNYHNILKEFKLDYEYFEIVKFDDILEMIANEMIKKYRMKTLDSIQLTSVKLKSVNQFVASDERLFNIAKQELDCECIFI